jgi:hypothetical protein
MLNITKTFSGEQALVRMENDFLRLDLAPETGGKISSLFNKKLQHEFLWKNPSLELRQYPPGTEYDPNFYGGIDELIPNDIPERIDGIDYPDHGELWTTALQYEIADQEVVLSGQLQRCGLSYQKTVSLNDREPVVLLDYIIRNESPARRHFLWKLHAALRMEAGDRLLSSAAKAKVADADYSRFKNLQPFNWPVIEGRDASIVPESSGQMDFFYLYEMQRPEMQMLLHQGKYVFSYRYDPGIFPFQWYFASYGGFLSHEVVILEPATGMPLRVNEAMVLKQCAVLDPGQEINCRVTIYAGEKNNS